MINQGHSFKNKKVLYKPLRILMLYFFGLIILYTLGPFEWRTQNPFFFYFLLFTYHLLLYLGYVTGMSRILASVRRYGKNERSLILEHKTIIKFLRVFIIVNLIMTLLFLIRTLGLSGLSIDSIMNNFLRGLTDAGSQYSSKFTTEKIFGGSMLAPIYTLMSPFLWPVIPLSIMYYKRLGVLNKALVIISIALEIIRWISTGTNKGIVDLILIVITLIALKMWQKKFERNENVSVKKNKRLRIILLIIILLYLGLTIFENNISSRVNDNFNIISSISNNTIINLESPIMKVVPRSLHSLTVYATQYLTQGYYGMSLAIDESFRPMLGIGNSYFLIANFEELLGIDIWKYTYQSRIAYEGWNPFLNWHSIYTWLANDFSFFGVIIIMFFIGKYFSLVFYKSLVQKDPIASVLFCMIVIAFFYFPANNQILSTPSTFMTFWGLNLLWFLKLKIKIKGKKGIHYSENNEYTSSNNESYE